MWIHTIHRHTRMHKYIDTHRYIQYIHYTHSTLSPLVLWRGGRDLNPRRPLGSMGGSPLGHTTGDGKCRLAGLQAVEG